MQCNKTHFGKYGLENIVFRDYLKLTEYDPRFDIIPYMPSLNNHGVPVLEYPSRPMFPRFYMGKNMEWDHMYDRDETVFTTLLLASIKIAPASYFQQGILMVEPCAIQFHLYRYTNVRFSNCTMRRGINFVLFM